MTSRFPPIELYHADSHRATDNENVELLGSKKLRRVFQTVECVVERWMLALEPMGLHVGRVMLLGRGTVAIE